MILSVDRVSKRFGATQAVKDVSLNISKGGITGFLGPNGAGKTTLIRMIMDIFKPDEGSITLARDLAGARKDHIGYLPEERGIYTKTPVRETLRYFAELKGLSREKAQANTDHFLERLEMTAVAESKIGKLSKGNQQKIQLISAMVARPDLLILDEPFSGLDPINVKLVSRLITELRDEGVTIVLSTHQMNQAEAFCEDIFLFNKGELILQGALEPIIQRYSGPLMVLDVKGDTPENSLFTVLEKDGGSLRIQLNEGVSQRELLSWLGQQEFEVRALHPYRVPLSEIFISEVSNHA